MPSVYRTYWTYHSGSLQRHFSGAVSVSNLILNGVAHVGRSAAGINPQQIVLPGGTARIIDTFRGLFRLANLSFVATSKAITHTNLARLISDLVVSAAATITGGGSGGTLVTSIQVANVGSSQLGTQALPSNPTGLALAEQCSTNYVALIWNANPAGDSVSGYSVFRASQGSSSYSQIATVSSPGYTDNSSVLTSGTNWTYYVTATNSAGNSGPSDIVIAQIP